MNPTLSKALAERGYDTLTDVQTAVTAPEISEADLLVSAQTGSGKTVGFGLAIAPTLLGEAEHFGRAAAPLALIIAPTRELAMQVSDELRWLYGKAGVRIGTCIGGMDARTERRTLERGVHIVVGTPGRLRDHITRGVLELEDIRAIVLDEADEMLALGFREDLEFMLGEAPAERRTLLFSATVSHAIAELAKSYQKDAVRISTISDKKQHADISYQAVQVAPRDTERAIINLLRFHDAPTAIVFANTRAAVARLTARFANRGFSVVSLSGELSQDERSHALKALRDGRARVCVATDVAARGIDLPNLELVIHADIPTNTEGLLHRSGRTGRAGRKGVSALIVPDNIARKAQRLLRWAKVEAEWIPAPSAEEILERDEKRLLKDIDQQDAPNEDEAAFAAKLLEQFSPEQLATACLRLYRSGLSAPEELNVHTAKRPQDARETFGPSKWVALSVGRDEGAEPRWLLPLLCRAGNLSKDEIGKIKMVDTETFVELKEASVAGFMDGLGLDDVLEGEVKVRLLDKAPDVGRGPKGPKGGKPRQKGKPHRGSKNYEGSRAGSPGRDKPKFQKPPRKERDDAVHSGAKPKKSKSNKPGTAMAGKASDGGKPKPNKAGGSAASKASRKPKHKPSRKGGDSAPMRRK